MSSYRIAPAVKAALEQATLLWPNRNRASDGTIGDAAHRQRRSWHNPCDRNGNPVPGGTVCAFDLTHDPAAGVDAHRMVRELVARRDQRVSEVISNGQIWTRARLEQGWRSYGGSNPHRAHAHVTVAWDHRNDTSPWWAPPATPDEEVEEEVVQSILFNSEGKTYWRDGGDTIHIPTMSDVKALLAAGVKNAGELSPELAKRLLEAAKQ